MRASLCWILLVSCLLLNAAVCVTVKCDQEIDNGENDCLMLTPQCLEYEYVPDPQNPDKFIVRCITCQEGLIPYWTHQNVEVDEFTDLPSSTLFMCAPNNEGKPVSCTSKTCIYGSLKACQRYTVSNLEYGAPGIFTGRFKCLECLYMYEPSPDSINLVYDYFKNRKILLNVCKRRVGTFDCGIICQLEFPGCARYQVSRLTGGQSTGLPETARFRCLEALPGYSILQEVVEETTSFADTKQLTLPAYSSQLMNCDGRLCQSVLPNCEQYYAVFSSSGYRNFYCLKCKPTMNPVNLQIPITPFINLYTEQRQFITCLQKPLESFPCDNKCKLEFPGCDSLTASLVEVEDQSFAVYKCDRCAEGFVAAPDDNYTQMWINGPASKNVKIRCVPKEVLEPAPVSGDLVSLLPHCQQYTVKFKEDGPNNAMEYTCHQCENGWEPTSAPVYAEWYSNVERIVCKHIPFPAPVECNDDCKQVFPNCDRVMVSKDPKGHNIYECLACQNGFYPIPYEQNTAGRLAFEDHAMRDQSKIYLCTNQQRERYNRLYYCDWHNKFYFEEFGCILDDNCSIAVSAKKEMEFFSYFKCLQCKEGYRLKATIPNVFGGDVTQCERFSVHTEEQSMITRSS